VAVEPRFIECQRRSGEQRLVAAAAIGRAGHIRGLDAVGGVAMRTDDV